VRTVHPALASKVEMKLVSLSIQSEAVPGRRLKPTSGCRTLALSGSLVSVSASGLLVPSPQRRTSVLDGIRFNGIRFTFLASCQHASCSVEPGTIADVGAIVSFFYRV
jgi:hypothetical protein